MLTLLIAAPMKTLVHFMSNMHSSMLPQLALINEGFVTSITLISQYLVESHRAQGPVLFRADSAAE